MAHEFTVANDARDYIIAGKALVTAESEKTGNHLTFKVKQCKDYDGNKVKRWFVSVLSGPDNEDSYSYIGLLDGRGGVAVPEFRLTAKSRYPETATCVRGFKYMWSHLVAGNLPPSMTLRHHGKCGRCGRTLTVPESIDRGIGPECWEKMGGM